MSQSTNSIWSEVTVESPPRGSGPDSRCDVCVVGAGIAGLTTAYDLAREGRRVVVLDAKPAVASGETEFTTAHLAWYLDDQFEHVASVRGDEVAKLAAESHRHAIERIAENIRRESIDCDFETVEGVLFAGESDAELIPQEAEVMGRLGLPFVRGPLKLANGTTVDALRFPNHGQFHPRKYLAGLTRAFLALGGTIHTETVVEKVRGGSPSVVTLTNGTEITVDAVVIATNNPFEGGTHLHTKVAAYLTYAFAAEIAPGSVPRALYWDTEDPYHYIRTQSGDGVDYLIVGGEDHKTGQADDQTERWDRLESWTRERFPQMGSVKYRWSGQVFETPDGLGLIGLAPWNGPNVYLITGDSGMGMTHSTLGAQLITDLIQGRPNDWATVYSPSREMLGAARSRLGESLNMVAQFKDWVTGGDVSKADDIPKGQGAIVRRGLTKLAIYKDDSGKTTTLSAVCPHMGCVVHWNPGESTWDCPCHGSRFSATGTCLHGPSTRDLAHADS